MITLIIAEDHQALIDGIKSFLVYEKDIKVIGEANDGEMLIDLVRELQPDVVITDIRMPKCDGIQATKVIKKEFPETQVIAFSMFDQLEAIEQMKEVGASGYIMKNASLKKLIEAIRTVAFGETFFDKAIVSTDIDSKEKRILSSREIDILKLIGQGKSSQEIADALNLSRFTIDSHRKNLLKKLNLTGKTELIRFALERKYDF